MFYLVRKSGLSVLFFKSCTFQTSLVSFYHCLCVTSTYPITSVVCATMLIFCLTLDWNEQVILTAHNQWQCDEAFLIYPEDSMTMAAIISCSKQEAQGLNLKSFICQLEKLDRKSFYPAHSSFINFNVFVPPKAHWVRYQHKNHLQELYH